MTDTDVATSPISRPKIHRPPAFLSSKPPRWKLAVSLPHFINGAHRSLRMAFLLVIVSAALFVVSRMTGTPGAGTVTVSVAHLEPSAGDAMASLPTMRTISGGDDSSQTILIEGKTEAIVGQLARLPSENSSISDIKTVSEVDNRTGRELLSIISKY